MPRANDELSRLFDEVADLLEIRGDDRFRILSYRRGADALRTLADDVASLSERELVAVRGIGKALAAKVVEFRSTGQLGSLEDLRADIPDGVRQMTGVPGLGPKRAKQLYDELGLASVDDLRAAASAGRLRDVRGFGAKAEEKLLRSLESFTPGERRILLERALPLAEGMVAALAEHRGVERAAYAGSVRRMRETIGDLDLLVASSDAAAVADAFRALPEVASVSASGGTKTSIVTYDGVQVDLRVVAPDEFGAAMQYFTGSKAHNVKVRERAVRMGLKLSEYGLFEADSEVRLAAATEEEVYERLGMQWVPPPMREDHGEVEAAVRGELPRLVGVDDLRGDLQSHSTYSDGRTPLVEMVAAAAGRGYTYYAITDHGARYGGLKALSLEDIARQRTEVDAFNRELAGRMTVLHGVEVDIGREGEIGYPHDVLAGFDLVVASVHGWFDLDVEAQTRRLVTAISNPHVHVIGHPSGRRLDKGRPGIELDLREVCEAAVRHRVALEISAHPLRLDLRDEHVRWARDHGALMVISTDAHSPSELGNIRFGVGTAQRGWLGPEQVINTWPLQRLRAFLAKEAV